MSIKRLAVYCGSASGADPAFAEAARELARLMVERDIELVYGGGRLGLMGIVADSVLEAGGRVYGVIPQSLVDHEVAHRGCTELHCVANMHERKAKMTELCDAFVCLRGGIGTLDEMFEALTLIQTNKGRRIPIILVGSTFWAGLIDWVKSHLLGEGMISPSHMNLFEVVETPEEVLECIFRFYEKRTFNPSESETEKLLDL